jgi:hypothetical protein
MGIPTALRNRFLADSFVEVVGALPCKGSSVFSGRFFSFHGAEFWGGRKLLLDISLCKGFKWKSPYSLGKLIEWKLVIVIVGKRL